MSPSKKRDPWQLNGRACGRTSLLYETSKIGAGARGTLQ